MDHDPRRRVRRAVHAKKATDPKTRRQSKRVAFAAGREANARQQTEFGPQSAYSNPTEPLPLIVPPPKRKRPARWAIALAVPLLLVLLVAGGYTLNVLIHAKHA